MAKLTVNGIEGLEARLGGLASRDAARRIVAAGAEVCARILSERTGQKRHVVTGSMAGNIRPGKYHEDLDVCWQDVYPQGNDGRGVSNAVKAFVINYGRGGKRTAKTGDKFITGKNRELQDEVSRAMQAEAARILQENTK